MASTVQTVLGPIPIDQLGLTLMHEHLRACYPGWEVDTTLVFDREREAARVAAKLAGLKRLGVVSLVDPCPMEIARDPAFMAEVSRLSGINVICTTGLYIEHGLPLAGFPPYFKTMREAQIQRIYSTELTQGIGPRRIRPGLIKCATGPHRIGKYEERALRAAARTALALDVRITTHTTAGSMGNEQLDIFLSEGMKPHHIVIGHSDINPDPAYHRSLMDRGCYVGFDTIGFSDTPPDDVRARNLVELVRAGYRKQIMLSQDNVGCWMFAEEDLPQLIKSLEDSPRRRYTYLLEEFVPKLLSAGISKEAIATMMVDNPRRYFAGEAL